MATAASQAPSAKPVRRNPWLWIAAVVAAILAAMEVRRLVLLIHWERTLPFARDLLPGAIAVAAATLAAYILIVLLIAWARGRKWGLALAIGWGAIETGVPLWTPVKNLWYQVVWRLHLTPALRHIFLGGAAARHTYGLACLTALLVVCAALAFARLPRERLDRGILFASFFYAAFYFLGAGILARLVTPR